ncbi:MAG: YecA family protein [Pseudomonadota bacterium]|nr:YecA family protein [Pseudomonadota bacterium]
MDFDQIKEAIAPFPELESPSFIQGMLIGLICGDNDIEEAVWIKKLIEEAQIKKVKESFLVALHGMFQDTNNGLNGSGFELNLCIPEDETDIIARAAMLGHLCEGVLYGLGLVGRLQDAEESVSKDVSEIVNDFGDIARIDIEALAQAKELGDAEESDLMQLVEFVRIGVMMINEELNPTQAAPIMPEGMDLSDPETIH